MIPLWPMSATRIFRDLHHPGIIDAETSALIALRTGTDAVKFARLCPMGGGISTSTEATSTLRNTGLLTFAVSLSLNWCEPRHRNLHGVQRGQGVLGL